MLLQCSCCSRCYMITDYNDTRTTITRTLISRISTAATTSSSLSRESRNVIWWVVPHHSTTTNTDQSSSRSISCTTATKPLIFSWSRVYSVPCIEDGPAILICTKSTTTISALPPPGASVPTAPAPPPPPPPP